MWAPDYVDLAEAKAYLRIGDTVDDAQISVAISAASRAIDRTTNRQFGLVETPEPRFYTAELDTDTRRWTIAIDDLMTEAGLLVAADLDDDGSYSYPVDNFDPKPANAAVNGRPWTSIVVHPASTNTPNGRPDAVRVTARFGWTAVPSAIKEACLLQTARMFSRRTAPFGVAGSPEMGSEVRLLAKLDPDVAVAVGPFTRWWAVA